VRYSARILFQEWVARRGYAGGYDTEKNTVRPPPYSEARTVFWIMDNGSSHRGQACVERLTQAHPRVVPVHGPVHASWLNQIEIYFSIVQRKALTPNDFSCLEAVAERLSNFERYYESIAQPFEWKLTRADLNALMARMRLRRLQTQPLKLAA
jgi:DDE superfamily endonuclease